jgi:uracil-DNA glycosylase family 4
MTPRETFDKKVLDTISDLQVPMDGKVFYEGNTPAPVMIVGFQVGAEEAKPFTSVINQVVRGLLTNMRVGHDLVMLTNLFKAPQPAAGKGVGLWVNFLFEEIKVVQPKAVILLGLYTAKAVLNLPHSDVENARRIRYVWPGRTETNFFVTYPPELLAVAPPRVGLSAQGVGFVQDLKAVFEADGQHFDRLVAVKG